MAKHVIHKLELPMERMGEALTINLPQYAKIIAFAEQYEGVVVIWYRFNMIDHQTRVPQKIMMAPTGHEFPSTYRYHSTAICHQGRIVLHLLEG